MRKVLCLVFLWVAGGSLLFGQSVPTLSLAQIPGDTSLLGVVPMHVTAHNGPAGDTLSPTNFLPRSAKVPTSRDSLYWVRFDLVNDTSEPQRRIFQTTSDNDQVHFYISSDGFRTSRHQFIGQFAPYWEVAYRYSNLFLPVDWAAGQKLSFLVKISSRYYAAPDPDLHLIRERSLERFFWNDYAGAYNGTYLSVFILGSVVAIFLFIAFLYITTRDSLYLYYGLYLGGVVLYFSTKVDSLFFWGYWVNSFPRISILLNEPIQMMYTSAYIRFSMGLLRVNAYDARLYRFLDVFWKGLVIYSIFMIAVSAMVWNRQFDQYLLAFDRVVLLPFNAVMLARILQKNRSPLLVYFLIGNVFFIAGVVVSTITGLGLVDPSYYAGLATINYFQMGVLGEIMCFSFALGYNVRLLERERNANQLAYINQLHVNQEFTENSNRELTEKLDERTKEVMAMSEALQQEKEAHLRSEFEFQLGEMEMQALRAQMNPHFIFNSLNTIRYFVLKNENEKASDYLGKFARLLRMVLQNSRENTIPLSEELEALRLYLEIESRRFGESFKYQIVVADDLDTEGIIVPPLLLQPFAENAIWHGLLHSNTPDRQLTVRISEERDFCLFVVEDNGIGRQKAQEMKSRSAHVKKSFGMQITNKRVELFNKNFSSQIKISVNDVVDPDGKVAGTSVEIRYQLPD